MAIPHTNDGFVRKRRGLLTRCAVVVFAMVVCATFGAGCTGPGPRSAVSRAAAPLSLMSPTAFRSTTTSVKKIPVSQSKTNSIVGLQSGQATTGISNQVVAPEMDPVPVLPPMEPFSDPSRSAGTGMDNLPPLEYRRLSFRSDVHELPSRFLDEVDSLVTCENAIFLGTAGGIAAVLHNNVDAQVASSGPRWGNVSDVITDFGKAVPVQLPTIGALYVTSLCFQDDDLHDLTLTMFTTYKFTLLSSVVLQYATHTRHENNGVFSLLTDSGFPSAQTATTFALAAVIDEAYGWQAGLPAYLFAGVIGWAEVDQNQHTVSEVFFGAALGFVIGKSIGAMHYRPDAPCKLVPLVDPGTGSQGLGVEFLF
jgi:membrane-associated phospholipid phosphatase